MHSCAAEPRFFGFCILTNSAVFQQIFIDLYALIVPTLFSGWYYSHYALANGIWYALIVLGLISWGVSLVRKVHSIIR